MDFFEILLATILGAGVLSLGVAIMLGYALYRVLRGLPQVAQTMVAAFMILLGLALIATAAGAGLGVITVLATAFVLLFNALLGRRSKGREGG